MVDENKAWVDVISGVEEADLISVEVIDKLIKDHKDAIKSHEEEIELSQASIQRLELKKKELKYGAETVIYELADELHEKTRQEREALGYEFIPFYWDNFVPAKRDTKQQNYYHKARKIIETAKELNVSVSKAVKLVTI